MKGAGRTPFSRGGDGCAALGPVLREYLVSEAMHALGIPTTRALAAATTGEMVYRDAPLPGAVLTRVAASHVRVGTFSILPRVGTSMPSGAWPIMLGIVITRLLELTCSLTWPCCGLWWTVRHF